MYYLITEHGRPIGRIVPVVDSVIEKLEQLDQAGIIAWSGQPMAPLTPLGQTAGSRTIADLLLEDRE